MTALLRSCGLALPALAMLFGVACAHTPPRPLPGYSFSVADKAADTALTMIGKPYRYGGMSASGFDCSGLVRFSYAAGGMAVPHSTKQLKRHTRRVASREMRKGDLLFFRENGRAYSHVGIYVGNDTFVHAPSTGKKVRTDTLIDPYWKRSFIDARRFL